MSDFFSSVVEVMPPAAWVTPPRLSTFQPCTARPLGSMR